MNQRLFSSLPSQIPDNWWKKSLVWLAGITSFCGAVKYIENYYESRGLTHPITAFLEKHISNEADDRQKRVDFMKRELKRIEARKQQAVVYEIDEPLAPLTFK